MYSWNDWSIHAQMLGYLEQNPIFNAINFNYPAGASTMGGAAANTVLLMRIKRSSARPIRKTGPNGPTTTSGAGGRSATSPVAELRPVRRDDCNNIAAITDGTSNSVAFSERLVGRPSWPD